MQSYNIVQQPHAEELYELPTYLIKYHVCRMYEVSFLIPQATA